MKPAILLTLTILLTGCATPRQAPPVDTTLLPNSEPDWCHCPSKSPAQEIQPPMPQAVERPLRAAAAASASAEMPAGPTRILLTWDENHPDQNVVSYNVYLRNQDRSWETRASTERPPMDLLPLFVDVSNGVYQVSCTAVNYAGLESEESSVVIFWYGHPTTPTNLAIEFTR
jgi:hypothetical protein